MSEPNKATEVWHLSTMLSEVDASRPLSAAQYLIGEGVTIRKPTEPLQYTTVADRSGMFVRCPHCESVWSCKENETKRFCFCPECGQPVSPPKV